MKNSCEELVCETRKFSVCLDTFLARASVMLPAPVCEPGDNASCWPSELADGATAELADGATAEQIDSHNRAEVELKAVWYQTGAG